jgi:transposase
MIDPGPSARVYVVCGATDMRKGYDGLHALVSHRLKQDPLSGHLYVFCNRERTRLKVLCWDGSGLWVCAKRLERGRFYWPESKEAARTVSREEWMMLVGGWDLRDTQPRRWYRK